MKVDAKTLVYIQNVVKTAQLVKIGNIIIEPDKVRAIDDEKSVVLFQDEDVPAMPFGSIGLNRIDVFMNRFELARSADKFEIEAIMPESKDNNAPQFARAIVMKGKGMKIDYRCANPATIQAPKQINDTLKYQIQMNNDVVSLMAKGQTAMNSDDVSIISNKDGVSFEITDINSDAMNYKFSDGVDLVDVKADQDDTEFSFKYPLKVILPLFKAAPSAPFFISTKGMLKIIVNELDMFVLPRV